MQLFTIAFEFYTTVNYTVIEIEYCGQLSLVYLLKTNYTIIKTIKKKKMFLSNIFRWIAMNCVTFFRRHNKHILFKIYFGCGREFIRFSGIIASHPLARSRSSLYSYTLLLIVFYPNNPRYIRIPTLQ